MAAMDQDIASARRAIAALAPTKYERRYPAALRGRLAALVRAHPEHGLTGIARRLDMAPQTLAKIVAGVGPALVPVRIIPEAVPRPAGIRVLAPHGLVIEGLDVAGVAELMRALS